jgi:hypothetical protein
MKRAQRKAPGKPESRKNAAQKRSKRQHPAQPGLIKSIDHPLYGEIPLIPEYYTYPSGKRSTQPWWIPDPTFRPRIPPHAVLGDPSKQDFCSAHHLPKYFYVDEEKICVQCGQPFTFTAHEQKFWYETLSFNFRSTAIRCQRCRRQRRSGRSLQHQLTVALQLADEKPKDPVALVTLARSTAEYFQYFGSGNLDRGIAAAHRAFKLAPLLYEALYWEGLCQEAAGRKEKACVLYDLFIAALEDNKRYRPLVKDAIQRKEMLEVDS